MHALLFVRRVDPRLAFGIVVAVAVVVAIVVEHLRKRRRRRIVTWYDRMPVRRCTQTGVPYAGW
jgi:hypothetical protein